MERLNETGPAPIDRSGRHAADWSADYFLPHFLKGSGVLSHSLEPASANTQLELGFTASDRNTSRYSLDRSQAAGNPWNPEQLPLPSSFQLFDTLSAPVLAADLKGRLHLAITANHKQPAESPRGGLFVLSSKSGENWERIIHVYNDNTSAIAGNPGIACDTTEMIGSDKNPYRNRLYVVWTVESTPDASSQFSELLFAESVDGGNTFVVPVQGGWRINPLRLNTGRAKVSNPSVEVDELGKITVAWTETNQDDGTVTAALRSSSNGGEGFGPVIRSSDSLLRQ